MLIELNAFGCTKLISVEDNILYIGEYRLAHINRNNISYMIKSLNTNGKYIIGNTAIFKYKGVRNDLNIPIFYFDELT